MCVTTSTLVSALLLKFITYKQYKAMFFREGVIFETVENKPSEHSVDNNTYPYETEEEYMREETKWDLQIEALISETCLTVPPHR